MKILKFSPDPDTKKRVLKMLQEHMGRKNDMMPICPHCREKIDLEKLANGVWIRKVEK
jgi:hypothetical protein